MTVITGKFDSFMSDEVNVMTFFETGSYLLDNVEFFKKKSVCRHSQFMHHFLCGIGSAIILISTLIQNYELPMKKIYQLKSRDIKINLIISIFLLFK